MKKRILSVMSSLVMAGCILGTSSVAVNAQITPNAYFRAFFKRLFVTCVLHIKPRLVSRCFIIS